MQSEVISLAHDIVYIFFQTTFATKWLTCLHMVIESNIYGILNLLCFFKHHPDNQRALDSIYYFTLVTQINNIGLSAQWLCRDPVKHNLDIFSISLKHEINFNI
jgi:hypothetical protein